MKIAIYTSCALNYYAKALALVQSARRNSPGATVTLCLCDVLPDSIDPVTDGFARCWTPPDLGYGPGWIFEHNIMELCTAVKGKALVELMKIEPDADLYVYLDPDVYIYNDLSAVLDYMGEASIGLVPHILAVEQTDIGVRMTEMSVTEHGIYNLGHLFVRNDANGRALAAWWQDRLDRYCFDDRQFGLFTDQRWMDLVPAVFDGVAILRQPNLDVASWNIAGRRLWTELPEGHVAGAPIDERQFRVNDYPLLTYHFSGTGPTGVHRRVREIFDPANPTAAEIERHYEAAIAANAQAVLEHVPPAYDLFHDGTVVRAEMRKLYRLNPDLQEKFPDPYRTTPAGSSFLDWLASHRPRLGAVMIDPRRLRQAFNELFDEAYYRRTYPEAAEAVRAGQYESALDHYVRVGSALLHDPNEFFVSRYYFAQISDRDRHLLRSRTPTIENTLLWHYLVSGLPNGHEPIEYFDSVWYLETYKDVRKALADGKIGTPLRHFIAWGSDENRQPGPDFQYLGYVPKDELRGERGGIFGQLVRKGGVTGRLEVPG